MIMYESLVGGVREIKCPQWIVNSTLVSCCELTGYSTRGKLLPHRARSEDKGQQEDCKVLGLF